jgi:hypothetical protein
MRGLAFIRQCLFIQTLLRPSTSNLPVVSGRKVSMCMIVKTFKKCEDILYVAQSMSDGRYSC